MNGTTKNLEGHTDIQCFIREYATIAESLTNLTKEEHDTVK